jgi:hypothetical protein
MDDAEARAILRQSGERPPTRGKLGADWMERAAELAASAPGQNGAEPGDDYDEGVSAADFGQPGAEPVSVAAEPPTSRADQLEQPPRRPGRRGRARGRGRPSLADRVRAAGKSSSGKAKKHHPRVRVDGLISRGWGFLGAAAMRVDAPLGRCLTMQAPVAGIVLEDAVKGTFIDRGLQPIARVEDRAEKVASVVLPPLIVAGLEMAQRLPEPQRRAREAILWPLLVESLVLGERVAGSYADEVLARAEQDAPARERATKVASAIFAVPTEEPATSDARETAAV